MIDVGDDDFDQRVVQASREVPVVVDFWAGWCQPCLVLGPVLERLAEEHRGRFVLARVDVDANPVLATRFGIQGIPAVKGFRDGEVVDEFVGVQPEELIRAFLKGLVPSEAEGTVTEARAAERRGDHEEAEAGYRAALAVDPEHEGATLGLARVLLQRDGHEEARGLLGRLPGSDEAERILAEAELRAAAPSGEEVAALRARLQRRPDDHEAALSLAAAEAGTDPTAALERCLDIVRAGGEGRDRAREIMLRIFQSLGDDHPLTNEYRPRLASALF